jgi:glucan phosphoethanolaminetransferase (alkaline phosphatase superfamily)
MSDSESENDLEGDLLNVKSLNKERLQQLVEILSNESTSLSKQNIIIKILIYYSLIGLLILFIIIII